MRAHALPEGIRCLRVAATTQEIDARGETLGKDEAGGGGGGRGRSLSGWRRSGWRRSLQCPGRRCRRGRQGGRLRAGEWHDPGSGRWFRGDGLGRGAREEASDRRNPRPCGHRSRGGLPARSAESEAQAQVEPEASRRAFRPEDGAEVHGRTHGGVGPDLEVGAGTHLQCFVPRKGRSSLRVHAPPRRSAEHLRIGGDARSAPRIAEAAQDCGLPHCVRALVGADARVGHEAHGGRGVEGEPGREAQGESARLTVLAPEEEVTERHVQPGGMVLCLGLRSDAEEDHPDPCRGEPEE